MSYSYLNGLSLKRHRLISALRMRTVVIATIAALLIMCLGLPVASADWIGINNATVKFEPPKDWTMASTPDKRWTILTSPTKHAVLAYTFFRQACESALDMDKMLTALRITDIKWKRVPVNGGFGSRFPHQFVDGTCNLQGPGCDLWSVKLDMGGGTRMLWLYAAAASAPDIDKYQARQAFLSLQPTLPSDKWQPLSLPVAAELQRRLSAAPVLFDARLAVGSDHWMTADHPCIKFRPPTGWTLAITSDGQWGRFVSPNSDAALVVATVDSRRPGEPGAYLAKAASALGVADIRWLKSGPELIVAIGPNRLWAQPREGSCRFQQPGARIWLAEVSPGPHPVAGATPLPPSPAPIWDTGSENFLLAWAISADAPNARRTEAQGAIDSLQWR